MMAVDLAVGEHWVIDGEDRTYLVISAQDIGLQEAITRYRDGAFKTVGGTPLNYPDSTVFFVESVTNTSFQPVEVIMSEVFPTVGKREFFLVDESWRQITHGFMTSDGVLNSDNSVKSSVFSFRFTVPPGPHLIFYKVSGIVQIQTKLIETPSAYSSRQESRVILVTIVYTVLTLMGLYNLSLFLQLKQTTYLIYTAYVFSLVFLFFQFPIGTQKLFQLPDTFNLYTISFATYLTCFLALMFCYSFNNLREYKRMAIASKVFMGLMLVLMVLIPLIPRISTSHLTHVAAQITTIACMAFGIYLAWRRSRIAYFYLFAWSTFLLGSLGMSLFINNIVSYNSFFFWSMPFGAVVETVVISLGLAEKIRINDQGQRQETIELNRQLHEKSLKLSDLNQDLESRVRKKSEELSSIIDHIRIGILLVGGKDLKIMATYSAISKTMLGVDDLEGCKAIETIFDNSSVPRSQIDRTDSILRAALGSDELTFLINQDLLVTDMSRKVGSNHMFIQLSWQPLFDTEGKISSYIVGLYDMTLTQKLRLEAVKKSNELQLISEIISTPVQRFNNTIKTSLEFIETNKRLLASGRGVTTQNLQSIFVNLHTIKGNSASSNLSKLSEAAHRIEFSVFQSLQSNKKVNSRDLRELHKEMEDVLNVYKKIAMEKLRYSEQSPVSISIEELETLQGALLDFLENRNPSTQETLFDLLGVFEQRVFSTIKSTFLSFEDESRRLAKALGKHAPVLEFEGDDHILPQVIHDALSSALIHLIRNTMDHGLEDIKTRRTVKKDVQGVIHLEVETTPEELILKFSDDGKGLDLNIIFQKARAANIIGAQEPLTYDVISKILFYTGFSTARVSNDISGRGVGMSSVQEHIEQLGGHVEIEFGRIGALENQSALPMTIIMRIPRMQFLRSIESIQLSA